MSFEEFLKAMQMAANSNSQLSGNLLKIAEMKKDWPEKALNAIAAETARNAAEAATQAENTIKEISHPR
jgi:hypothetical protein